MQRVQSGRDIKMKQINDNIDDVNRNIRRLQDMRNCQDLCKWIWFEAEEKSTIAEIKNLICKSNALKHAATENQNLLDNFVKKRRLLIEKKDQL